MRTNLLPGVTRAVPSQQLSKIWCFNPQILSSYSRGVCPQREMWAPARGFPEVLGTAPALGAFSGFGAGSWLVVTSGKVLCSHSAAACPVSMLSGAGIYLGFYAKLIKLLISQKREVHSWHRVKLLHLSKASSKGYSVCLHSHKENLVKLCLGYLTAVLRAAEEHAVRRDAFERCHLV